MKCNTINTFGQISNITSPAGFWLTNAFSEIGIYLVMTTNSEWSISGIMIITNNWYEVILTNLQGVIKCKTCNSYKYYLL